MPCSTKPGEVTGELINQRHTETTVINNVVSG